MLSGAAAMWERIESPLPLREGGRGRGFMAVEPRARFLRENTTHTEKLLWAQLRKKRVGDLRFRRQYVIGNYIVDFVCLPARLIVEIDGPSHDQTADRDERRTAWLNSQGFEVLRFTNRDILSNLEGVVLTIANAIAVGHPSPNPLPQGEGGFEKGDAGWARGSRTCRRAEH